MTNKLDASGLTQVLQSVDKRMAHEAKSVFKTDSTWEVASLSVLQGWVNGATATDTINSRTVNNYDVYAVQSPKKQYYFDSGDWFLFTPDLTEYYTKSEGDSRYPTIADFADINLAASPVVIPSKLAGHRQVGGAAGGAVGVGAGVEVLVVRNSSTLDVSPTSIIAGTIKLDALLNRNIDHTAYAAGAGAVGVAVAVSVINLGGTVQDKDTDGSLTKSIAKANEQTGQSVSMNGSSGSATLTIGGILTATTITGNAKVNNKIDQDVIGIGIGIGGGAAAVAVMNVSDDVSVKVLNGATLNGDVTLSALTTAETIYQNTVAGAGGLGALGAAVGVVNVNSDNTLTVGNNATLEGNTVNLNAGLTVKDAKLDASSVAVGGVSVSGAVGTMNFGGNTAINVNSGNIYAKYINIHANDTYNSLVNRINGIGGGAVAVGGTGSYLDIKRGTTVNITGNSKLGSRKELNPNEWDFIDISALATVTKLDNQSALRVVGAFGGGYGKAESDLLLDTAVNLILGADNFFRTGKLAVNSSGSIFERYANDKMIGGAIVKSLVEFDGAIGLPFAGSELKVTTKNTIDVSGAIIDAWRTGEAVSFNVGGGNNNLNAATYLSNYSVVPVVSAPKADAILNKTDTITFTSADIKSVSNIVASAGKGANNVVGYSEGRDIYREIAAAIAGFFGADADFTLKGGKSRTNANGGVINFKDDNTFVAGSHANSEVIIKADGTITHSPWIKVVTNADAFGERRIGDEIINQINSLREALGNQGVVGTLDELAYTEEIDYLKRQLRYYCTIANPTDAQLLNPANYPTVTVVMIVEDITAAAGDIIINAATVSASNSKLTANAVPSITITNNSQYFLQIGDGKNPVRLVVPNPLDGGGRVLINDTLVETLAGATLESVRLGRNGEPAITITNTQSSSVAGSGIATELLLQNATLSNPGGKTTLSSKGSIWQYNSIVGGRDIEITTAGSYYLNSKDGIYSTGTSDPFGSGTNVATAINQWIQEQMLITGGLSKAQIDIIIKDLEKQFSDTYGASYSEPNVNAAISNINGQIAPLKATYLNYVNNLARLYGGMTYSFYDDMMNGTNGTNVAGAASERYTAATALNNAVTNDVKSRVTNWDSVMKQESFTYVSDINENGTLNYTTVTVWVKTGDFSYAVKTPANGNTPAVYYTESDINGFISALNQYGISVDIYNTQKSTVDNNMAAGESQARIFDLNRQVDALNDIKNNIASLTAQRTSAPNTSPGDVAAMKALLAYRDSIAELQNAVTTASWDIVFGANGTGNRNQLISRTTDQNQVNDETLRDLINAVYSGTGTEAELEKALANSALAYVKDRIKNVSSAKNANVNGLVTDYSETTPLTYVPERESIVYGARSVFISAETLNINGTIQSGYLETKIDLTLADAIKALNNYNTSNENAAQASSLALTMAALGITDKDDPRLAIYPTIFLKNGDQIVIENLIAYGGDITLSGNIISTGRGKVEVADGYGNFQIIGNPEYDLILNRVDAGMGSEGVIRIIDKAKGYVTEYTRVSGIRYGTEISSDERDGFVYDPVKNHWTRQISGLSYDPVENRWLENVFASNTELSWEYKTYNRYTVLFGKEMPFDWSKDPADSIDLNTLKATADVNKTYPVGTFLVTDTTLGSGLLYGVYSRTASKKATSGIYRDTFITKIGDEVRTGKSSIVLGAGWREYSVTIYASQSFTEVFKTYLNASQPINISFTGSEIVADAGVNITNARGVTINDIVRSAGSITIDTVGNLAGGENNLIIGQDVSLTARNIGNANQTINLEPLANGTLTVNRTGTGTDIINIHNTGEILVNSINANGADVRLISTGNVLDNGMGIFNANRIEVNVGIGRIGGRNETDAFKMSANNNVLLSASGNINAEFDKTLYAESIVSTNGNVNLYVVGDLLDANPNEVPDPLSDYAKGLLWEDLADTTQKANEQKWESLTKAEERWNILQKAENQGLSDTEKQNLWKELYPNLSDAEIVALWEDLTDIEIRDLFDAEKQKMWQ